ncbi:OLC1v1007883C1 [Oldenlandia corymbosa var. corymbosa]|uniref:OLC1v1007883C1 n=1 Tax=Oldenlandia corymbosa var. corymbosa TaxID=529605 RepID=A0AAV1DN31_OLDCO|nr:OLC1v1007883C1 [Oldenlandia corymbosa var. corymbosa]
MGESTKSTVGESTESATLRLLRTKKNIASIKPEKNRTDGLFTVRIHFNGFLTNPPRRQYKGGEVSAIYKCDPDYWSKIEVDDFAVTKLGLVAAKLSYYYLQPGKGMDDGLFLLFCNDSMNKMAALGLKETLVYLFVVHSDAGEDAVLEIPISQLTQEQISTTPQKMESTHKNSLSPRIPARMKVAAVKFSKIKDLVILEREMLKRGAINPRSKAKEKVRSNIFSLVDVDDSDEPPEIEILKIIPRCGVDHIIGYSDLDEPTDGEGGEVNVDNGDQAQPCEKSGARAEHVEVDEGNATIGDDAQHCDKDGQLAYDTVNKSGIKEKTKANGVNQDEEYRTEKAKGKRKVDSRDGDGNPGGVEETKEVEANGSKEMPDSDYELDDDVMEEIMKDRMHEWSKILGNLEEKIHGQPNEGESDGSGEESNDGYESEEFGSDDARSETDGGARAARPKFRRVLLPARSKPFYTLLECVRMLLSDKYQKKREMISRLNDRFGPKEKPFPFYDGGDFRIFNHEDFETVSDADLDEMAKQIGIARFVTFYSISDQNGVEAIVGDRRVSILRSDALVDDSRLIVLYALNKADEYWFARNNNSMINDDEIDGDVDLSCYCDECWLAKHSRLDPNVELVDDEEDDVFSCDELDCEICKANFLYGTSDAK